jgi:hypothetical protein
MTVVLVFFMKDARHRYCCCNCYPHAGVIQSVTVWKAFSLPAIPLEILAGICVIDHTDHTFVS